MVRSAPRLVGMHLHHEHPELRQIPFFRFLEHLEAVGMTEEEIDVVVAPHTYREVHRIRGGSFDSPEDWAEAIRDAQEREQEQYARLTGLGFPDTSDMSVRDGHLARISHLMVKYPQADWDMLLAGQEEAMERKGNAGPRPSPPVTVQYIEQQKIRFLGRLLHRDELMRDGDKDGMLPMVVRSYLKVKEFLERHGVDTQELAKSKNTVEYFNHPLADSTRNSTAVDAPAGEPKTVEAVEQTPSIEEAKPAKEPSVADPLTMTAREASKLLGLTYQTVIRCLASGDLPYGKKVGRYWLITREPFMAWLDSNTDTVRSMTAQAGEKPGKKPSSPEPSLLLPMSTRGRTPSF